MSKKRIFAGVLALIIAAGAGYFVARKQFLGAISIDTASAQSLLTGARTAGAGKENAAALTSAMSGKIITVKSGELIQDAVNLAKPGDTVQVMPGTYSETVYIDKDNIALIGVIQEGQWPTLDGIGKLNDAVLYSGNGIRVENFKIIKYKGNAIMGQAGNNFVIRHNWIQDTGVYGIFPQFGQNGLIQYNVLSGIEDAAIYVGMSDNIQVDHNEVHGNVAGIEIENSRHAVVENNMVYDNAGGILTFVTPWLPIKTTFDVIIRNNFIVDNNHKNFGAPGSIVSGVPSGSGIIVMAAKDVMIENNVIRNNKNAGIIVADHKSFANITIDPESDPYPDRIQVLSNLFSNNGTEPMDEIKALMLASMTRQGPDIVAVGGGSGSCMVDRATHATLGISSWAANCPKATTADIVTLLLDKPAVPRSTATVTKGQVLYNGICAGCHAYSARMIGPPTQIIQALYLGNPQGIADYIAKPSKKREDFPPMPSQGHLTPELRLTVAEYMLSVKN
ncbi:parallel beta-helix domain-containing protein [Solimicrobium silvestre]|uniref:Parallel beta-helix repeat-containing protein n=1 Tax=Solimicrobium silvestre TaxID=2099400 RepID=A0A2S9GVX1_9BURK|nr:parallel beta-helix domain-containing protein [Solimicrobium silvestre]PRC91864.1 Parallel beta-helix repeat-containing protein [Solimicrobium silvestre]